MKYFAKFSLIALVLLFVMAGLIHYTETPVHATLGTGAYSTVSYDSTNFFPTQSMTFTMGTQNTYRYNIDANNQMHLMIDLYGASIGGTTASAFLCVKIPEGRTSHNTVTVPAHMATDNGNSGTWEALYGLTSVNSGSICFRRASGANFAANSGTFRIDANVVLEVNDAQ